jgi:hypothetical protein
METTQTFTKTCDLELFNNVLSRTTKANARAAKNGLTGRIDITSEEAAPRHVELWYRDADGRKQPLMIDPVTPATRLVERCTVTITLQGEFTIGDFTPVCHVEFEGESHDYENWVPVYRPVGDIERQREVSNTDCDHCNNPVQRRSIWIVQDTDGVQYHIGSTCVADYLGVDGEHVLDLHKTYAEMGAEFDNSVEDDDEWDTGKVEIKDNLQMFVAAAITACSQDGYQKKGSDMPTVESAATMKMKDMMTDAYEWAAYAIQHWASITPQNDFERNLHTIATADIFKISKHAGLAAYMGEGFRREFVKFVNLCNAKAERSEIPAELNDTRTEINGTVISTATKMTDFGEIEKMRVEDSRGFIVYGTNFNDAAIGDTVKFIARICTSDKDETFGFFTRPKAVA